MREVAVQASNDTNNSQDRQNLQAEIDALVTEINRIASTTTWAGEKLMEDEFTDFSFQVGAKTASENQISIKINGMGSHALGLKADPADGEFTPQPHETRQANITAGVVTANGDNESITLLGLGAAFADVTYNTNDADSVNNAVTAINAGTAVTNVKATVLQSGDIILSHDGTATGAGSYEAGLAGVQAAYDTINSRPAATAEIINSGTDMIISFDEDATSYDVVLAKDSTSGAAADKSTVTFNPADLQTTVDFINDGGGTAGAGEGTAIHGYTASIVASGTDSTIGTIMLTKGSGSATQLTFPGTGPLVNQIDLGSATSAIIPIVSRLASGMSAAMKSIPASLRLSRKAASLVSLSILATTRVAPEALQRSMASVSFGRRLFFPLSISTSSSITFQSPPFR